MDQVETTLLEDGQIVIPPAYLKTLGLKAGDVVIVRLEENAVCIFTPKQAIKNAQKLVRTYIPQDGSLADELIAERRQEDS